MTLYQYRGFSTQIVAPNSLVICPDCQIILYVCCDAVVYADVLQGLAYLMHLPGSSSDMDADKQDYLTLETAS